MTEKTYYYTFKRFNAWSIMNLILCAALTWLIWRWPYVLYCCPQTWVLIGLFLLSLAGWCFKYMTKQRLAVVTDDFIKIDHCAPLYWKDIAKAEERVVSCCFSKYKILALIPKDGIDYKYNYLQRHNGQFTPFSIPLYGIVSDKDIQELTKTVKSKIISDD